MKSLNKKHTEKNSTCCQNDTICIAEVKKEQLTHKKVTWDTRQL